MWADSGTQCSVLWFLLHANMSMKSLFHQELFFHFFNYQVLCVQYSFLYTDTRHEWYGLYTLCVWVCNVCLCVPLPAYTLWSLYLDVLAILAIVARCVMSQLISDCIGCFSLSLCLFFCLFQIVSQAEGRAEVRVEERRWGFPFPTSFAFPWALWKHSSTPLHWNTLITLFPFWHCTHSLSFYPSICPSCLMNRSVEPRRHKPVQTSQ